VATVEVAIAHDRIGEELGQRGTGEVYRAVDTRLGRSVAVSFCRTAWLGM
jgi:hypothetical protein